MTTLSELFPSASLTVQSGLVATGTLSSGSGEDVKYVDVTISAVDTAKAKPSFFGGFDSSANYAIAGSSPYYGATLRFTSTTNLRISCGNNTVAGVFGRWYVEELA